MRIGVVLKMVIAIKDLMRVELTTYLPFTILILLTMLGMMKMKFNKKMIDYL